MTQHRRYPRGISRDHKGWRLAVGIGQGQVHRQRFPASTPFEAVKAALARARLKWTAARRGPATGTLGADVTRYLRDYCTGRPHAKERTRHLALWLGALGADTQRHAITKDDVSRVLHDWRVTLAADTCNKRRTALLALYHALDGRGAGNPVREIPKFRAPDPLPRGLDYDQIEKALAQLPPCKTKARLAVLAYTGIRAGQLMRLAPDDWNHREHVLTVPGTAKGRGTKPYVVPLSSRAQQALTALDAADAWGAFSWAPMARMWKEAWIAETTGQDRRTLRGQDLRAYPAPVPYDLRHSWASAIYRATGDLKATKELLGHSSIRMTERYMLAAVPERNAQAVRAFERDLNIKEQAKQPPQLPTTPEHQ